MGTRQGRRFRDLVSALAAELGGVDRLGVIDLALVRQAAMDIMRSETMQGGRRSGKTRAMAVLAAYVAALCDHSAALAPGERALLPILSATVWQSGKAQQYLDGLFSSVPALAALVTSRTSDTITLANGVDLECRPANFRTIRGVTCIAVIADEAAFWRNEESRNPDKEILDAARLRWRRRAACCLRSVRHTPSAARSGTPTGATMARPATRAS